MDDSYELLIDNTGGTDPTQEESRAHGPLEGLEGPVKVKGRLVYYDPSEGMYFDPDTGAYIEGF